MFLPARSANTGYAGGLVFDGRSGLRPGFASRPFPIHFAP
jgi:hypothetical protein